MALVGGKNPAKFEVNIYYRADRVAEANATDSEEISRLYGLRLQQYQDAHTAAIKEVAQEPENAWLGLDPSDTTSWPDGPANDVVTLAHKNLGW